MVFDVVHIGINCLRDYRQDGDSKRLRSIETYVYRNLEVIILHKTTVFINKLCFVHMVS